MTLTMRIVNLVDKLRLQNLFVEENNRTHLKLMEFSPAKLEEALDKVLRTKGKSYRPSNFERDVLEDLDF